ncbi:MAG: hypothetical protein KJ579_09200 [Verrucomicrobia bacterium]|nr:hypothetical protein [Verrucomicrobiota bacterium]
MKTNLVLWAMAGMLVSCVTPQAKDAGRPGIEIRELDVAGEIKGDNLIVGVAFEADVRASGVELPVARGMLSLLGADPAAASAGLPRGVTLSRREGDYLLTFDRRGAQKVALRFAVQAAVEGDLRRARVELPDATIRRVRVVSDRADLDLKFDGALNVESLPGPDGGTVATAFLGSGSPLDMRWRPKVAKLTGDLAASCDLHTIAVAGVGALRIDSLLTYRVVQGALRSLAIDLPAGLNVTQVRGADIREWSIEPGEGGARRLAVALSRPQEKVYQLGIEGETVLPAFPTTFELGVPSPRDVIRASGFLLVGADGAIKLVVQKAAGLTQIDRASLPDAKSEGIPRRAPPSRSAYAYQFANLPVQMQLSADDIVTAIHAEERLVVSLVDNDLALQAAIELDVRDAPAREITVETDPAWTVAQVTGRSVGDSDVRDEGGVRKVRVVFKQELSGRGLVELRLERTLKDGDLRFAVPRVRVSGARTERGHIVLRAEKGVRLEPSTVTNLREMHTGSLPVAVPGAQRAWRFKDGDWALAAGIEREEPALHAELFHLATLGESGLYGSCSITYFIAGAPTRTLRVRIPPELRNVEITGRDIRARQQDGDVWTVQLQDKVHGDYTLLVTYQQPAAFEGGEVAMGGIRTIGPESETGYLVLAGAASLAFAGESRRDAAILPIAPEELPREYALLVSDRVLHVAKYVGGPHVAVVKVRRLPTLAPVGQVADHTTLETRVGRDGEAVTEVTCFVKNTSQQYLGVTLPKGAALWSAKVDGVAVQALDRGQGAVLVPVERRLDPNQPLRIGLTYAQQMPGLGWFNRLGFAAPAFDTRTVFARWSFTAPERFHIAGGGGTMMAPARPPTGLAALGSALGGFFTRLVGGGIAWLVLGVLVALAGAPVAFNIGARRAASWTTWVAAAAGAVVAVLLVASSGAWGCLGANGPANFGLDRTWEFTKPVTLADGGLAVSLAVSPDWLALVRMALTGLVAVLAGAALVRRGVRSGRRVAGWAAGLAVVAWAASSIPVALPWAAGILGVLLALAPLAGWLRAMRNAGRRRASPPFPSEPPPAGGDSYASRIPPASPAPPAAGAAVALLLLAAASAPAAVRVPAASDAVVAPAATVRRVEIAVDAPDVSKPEPRNARIAMALSFKTAVATNLLVLPSPRVLTGAALGSANLRLVPSGEGVLLYADRAGEYRVSLTNLAPVIERNGAWMVDLWLPDSVENEVVLKLPGGGWDVESPQAVWIENREEAPGAVARLVAGPGSAMTVAWRPRQRKTETETAAFFAEVNTCALLQPGLAGLTHSIRYQIAQGELQALKVRMPEGVSVTAVSGVGLGTWRFDPATRMVDALLEKPVAGAYALVVVAQRAFEGLPYEAELREPEIVGASRQRGTLAVAATPEVQVSPGDTPGMSLMNVSDFPADVAMAALRGASAGIAPEMKRAYRYHQLPASAKVSAVRVLPEVRVTEEAQVDVSDERVVLTSRLAVQISRAGLFSMKLAVPEGFDVDSLTGKDVSHWDEVRDGAARGVLVNFSRQVLGDTELNLVLSRAEKRVEPELRVPRLAVDTAAKHAGTLVVSGERGLRFVTAARDGVTEINPRDLGIQQPGCAAFRLLRPDWQVTLKTEVLQPVVKSDLVHRVDVSEGLMRVRAHIRYGIEHAGVKLFKLRAPRPGLPLMISGRNLARVQETDAATGLWEVELHGKVETDYALDVTYQDTFDPATNTLSVLPLRAAGVDAEKAWLVVFAGGRLQVKPGDVPAGLRAEDPRGIPATFGAGDLSGAVLCYRATDLSAPLPLSILRHTAAEVLPGRVQSARLTSVVSDDGQMVTRAVLTLDPGTLRFLEMTVPEGGEVWSVFLNGRAASPLFENGRHMIPLERGGSGAAVVDVIYGHRGGAGGLWARREVRGPTFNLPLADIEWELYVPPQYRYLGFGGTLVPTPAGGAEVAAFRPEDYDRMNKQLIADNNGLAVQVLEQGAEMWRNGQTVGARQAFEAAVAYSQGKQDLNEDARIQYRNLAKQQAVVVLANRRAALKAANNVADESGREQMRGFNDGNWSSDYARKIEASLGAKESESLGLVAERLLDQQQAAGAEIRPIRITVPVQGRRLVFRRDLQIKPGAEMLVTFRAAGGPWSGALAGVALLAALAALLAFAARLWLGPSRKMA